MADNDKKTTFSADIIDTALPNCWGVAKHDGMVYFLPEGAVGDTVAIKKIKKTKNFSYGEIIQIEKKSPHRIDPLCPHSEKCSGCVFQNLKYDIEIDIKKNYAVKTLAKFAGLNETELKRIKFYPAEEISYYRNKIEFSLNLDKGKINIGFNERLSPLKKFSNNIIPIDSCIIFSKSAQEIITILKQWIKTNYENLYDKNNKKPKISKIGIKESKNKSEILVYLITDWKKNFPDTAGLYDLLKDKILNFKGLSVLKKYKNLNKSDELIRKHGSLFITEQLGGLKFQIYPNTFFQPNTKMALIIYNLIAAKILRSDRILSLYCGSGVLEIFLSRYAKQITGIDVNKFNIKTAKENLKFNNIENCAFFKKFAEHINQDKITHSYDKLIIDPPRSGLTKHAADIICGTNIAQIIYLSCSAPTLARDIKILKQHNYLIKSIDIIDQFPRTAHIETLVCLEKKK